MEGLFIVEGNHILPQPELLVLEPFKEIWEKNPKSLATDMIAYVYFMSSYSARNPFIGYEPENRSAKILSSLTSGIDIMNKIEDGSFNPSYAIEMISELQEQASVSMRFYKAAIEGAEKLITFFSSFSFTERSLKTGLPLYKPADITRALKETTEVLKTLQSMRDKVRQELMDSSRATKQRRVNPFER